MNAAPVVKVNPYLAVTEPLAEDDGELAVGEDPRIKQKSKHDGKRKAFEFHKQGVHIAQVPPQF